MINLANCPRIITNCVTKSNKTLNVTLQEQRGHRPPKVISESRLRSGDFLTKIHRSVSVKTVHTESGFAAEHDRWILIIGTPKIRLLPPKALLLA